ncbi:MAG: hypothetical protein ACQEXX_13760 [Bacillota bacterium]
MTGGNPGVEWGQRESLISHYKSPKECIPIKAVRVMHKPHWQQYGFQAFVGVIMLLTALTLGRKVLRAT